MQMSCHSSPSSRYGSAMSEHSREGEPHHARKGSEIWRLQAGDAGLLFEYLRDKDIWPVPCQADLVLFLGRKDAAVFGGYRDGRIAGMIASVIDQAALRVVYVVRAADSKDLGLALLAQTEAFARSARASTVFAQVLCDSDAHRLLVDHGYTEDYKETDVLAGRAVCTVDLIKLL